MSSKPLVTVGLIAYNRDTLIGKSIRSLLSQSYSNIELIISNDASSDQTDKICRNLAKKDKRITYYQQKKNLGLAHNSNFVLQKARGKYFMWASDDDLWHKDFIKTLVNLLEENKHTVLAMSNYYLFKDGYRQYVKFKFKKTTTGFPLVKNYLLHPTLLIWGIFRTDVLKQAGGFHTDSRPFLHKGSDALTVFRLLLKGNLAYSRKTLLYKRDSGFALDRYKILEDLNFTPDITYRIKRYCLYPLMFTYDLFYFLKYSLTSSYGFYEKLVMAAHSFCWYLRVNVGIIDEIIKGTAYIIKGIVSGAKKFGRNEFSQGGAILIISNTVSHVLNYLSIFIIARSLGPIGYGEITVFFSYASIFSVPISVLSIVLTQKISSARNSFFYSESLEALFLKKLKKWWFLFIFPLLLTPFIHKVTNLTQSSSYLLLPFILLAFIGVFYGAALQGMRLFSIYAVIGLLPGFFKLIGAILTSIKIDGTATILLFIIFSSILSFIVSHKVVKEKAALKTNKSRLTIGVSWRSVLLNQQIIVTSISMLGLVLYSNFDLLVVKRIFSSEEAGVYSAWSFFAKLPLYIIAPMISISFVYFASNLYKKHQEKVLVIAILLFIIASLILLSVYWYFGSFFIRIFFGEKFIKLGPYLPYAALFSGFYASIAFISNYFLARKNLKALVLPLAMPLYIFFLFLMPKQLSSIMILNVVFSLFVIFLYGIVYFFGKIISNRLSKDF